MNENKIFISILVFVLLVHFICVIFYKKWRIKFFDHYVRLDIAKKYKIIDKCIYSVLEKSWYIKQSIIIFISFLVIAFIDFNEKTIIYMVLFWTCIEITYRFSLIHYAKKKNMIQIKV